MKRRMYKKHKNLIFSLSLCLAPFLVASIFEIPFGHDVFSPQFFIVAIVLFAGSFLYACKVRKDAENLLTAFFKIMLMVLSLLLLVLSGVGILLPWLLPL